MQSIGQRIKDARKKNHLTQSQLAEKAFVSDSYIAMIELDKRNPSTDVVIRIAEILGVSPETLLLGSSQDTENTLFNEWKSLMRGRSISEIENAHLLVKQFFKSLDDINKKG